MVGRRLKFLCSYGGKILPRYPDGKLRYVGGVTRVLAVDRFTSFAELLVKLGELCGFSVRLRCQLPTEDLDTLVSVTSNEDLSNVIEEYDRASAPVATNSFPLKIRAFLSPPKALKKVSPSQSATAGSRPKVHRFGVHHVPTPVGFPDYLEKSIEKLRYYGYHAEGSPQRHSAYLVHNGQVSCSSPMETASSHIFGGKAVYNCAL